MRLFAFLNPGAALESVLKLRQALLHIATQYERFRELQRASPFKRGVLLLLIELYAEGKQGTRRNRGKEKVGRAPTVDPRH